MMKPLVEFCVTNIANHSLEAFRALEKDYSIDILEYGCLSYCGKCEMGPYAVVNGKVIEAKSNEELLESIYKYLEMKRP